MNSCSKNYFNFNLNFYHKQLPARIKKTQILSSLISHWSPYQSYKTGWEKKGRATGPQTLWRNLSFPAVISTLQHSRERSRSHEARSEVSWVGCISPARAIPCFRMNLRVLKGKLMLKPKPTQSPPPRRFQSVWISRCLKISTYPQPFFKVSLLPVWSKNQLKIHTFTKLDRSF